MTLGHGSQRGTHDEEVSRSGSALSQLITAVTGLGEKATWTLSCVVDGATVTRSGSYSVTSTSQSPSVTIDLQSAVGSPLPQQCTLANLKSSTTLALPLSAIGLTPFAIGVTATATTAVPGAVWQSAGSTASGARAVICADDTGNGNAGSVIQAWNCLSDLADYYTQTAAGQLVHNGDCVTADGNRVLLGLCTADNKDQRWLQSAVGGTVRNVGTGTCLTSTSGKNGSDLTVRACGSAATQKWVLPSADTYTVPANTH